MPSLPLRVKYVVSLALLIVPPQLIASEPSVELGTLHTDIYAVTLEGTVPPADAKQSPIVLTGHSFSKITRILTHSSNGMTVHIGLLFLVKWRAGTFPSSSAWSLACFSQAQMLVVS